jgi:DNA mismatch endonuclease (patch repair protein)
MDTLSVDQRSLLMSRIRGKDTAPELAVRSLLHRMGFRFRLHRRDLPGTPDIVLPRHATVVFVHGCFWHRHAGCKGATTPKTRRAFWRAKFEANVERDRRNRRDLRKLGWKVLTVWECQIRKTDRLESSLRRALGR